MNTVHVDNFLPLILQIIALPNYRCSSMYVLQLFCVLHCGDTPVADREVQFLSDLAVAELISKGNVPIQIFSIELESTKNKQLSDNKI